MSQHDLKLSSFSFRTLNLLALIFGGGEARVILSDRAKHPLTVALGSRTIVLHPERAGLYDLALGARLLLHRKLLSSGPADAQRKDRWLTLKAQRQLVKAAHTELREKFRLIDRLPGRYLPGRPATDLQVVDRTVEWEALKKSWNLRPPGENVSANRARPTLEMGVIPELQITGTDDDYSWLQEALEAGELPLSHLPQLDELPYLRIPLSIAADQRFPMLEEWEEQLANAENKELIAGLMRCRQQKSIVRQERMHLGRPKRSGMRLDPNRLVEAVIGARVGLEVPLFRQPGSVIEPVFDPREHLTVITFDLNDLKHLSWDGNRAAVLRFLAILVTCFQRLDVDTIIQATADRLLTLADGRTVCLHFTASLKSLDEPFDELFWNRWALLMQKPPVFPGEAACFHPLGAEDIAKAFDEAAFDREHSYRTLVWWARHLLPGDNETFRRGDFLERCAGFVDHQIGELGRRLDGTFDTEASFLPQELRQYGDPRGYLQSITWDN